MCVELKKNSSLLVRKCNVEEREMMVLSWIKRSVENLSTIFLCKRFFSLSFLSKHSVLKYSMHLVSIVIPLRLRRDVTTLARGFSLSFSLELSKFSVTPQFRELHPPWVIIYFVALDNAFANFAHNILFNNGCVLKFFIIYTFHTEIDFV